MKHHIRDGSIVRENEVEAITNQYSMEYSLRKLTMGAIRLGLIAGAVRSGEKAAKIVQKVFGYRGRGEDYSQAMSERFAAETAVRFAIRRGDEIAQGDQTRLGLSGWKVA